MMRKELKKEQEMSQVQIEYYNLQLNYCSYMLKLMSKLLEIVNYLVIDK